MQTIRKKKEDVKSSCFRNHKISKKGVSVMVGYVLLISIAIIISAFVYQWLKTYVPSETPKCDDGVSVFIANYSYCPSAASQQLNLTIKNNGKFSIAGYFIHGTEDTTNLVKDLSNYNDYGLYKGKVIPVDTENSANPGDYVKLSYGGAQNIINNFTISGIGTLKSIELIPARYQTYNNKNYLATCGKNLIRENIQATC